MGPPFWLNSVKPARGFKKSAVLVIIIDFLSPVDLRSRSVDSCGRSWSGETPQELATRRLSASQEEFVL
jgi:hypothetical protein